MVCTKVIVIILRAYCLAGYGALDPVWRAAVSPDFGGLVCLIGIICQSNLGRKCILGIGVILGLHHKLSLNVTYLIDRVHLVIWADVHLCLL